MSRDEEAKVYDGERVSTNDKVVDAAEVVIGKGMEQHLGTLEYRRQKL